MKYPLPESDEAAYNELPVPSFQEDLLLQLTPEQKRRAWRGWCLYDWANSAFATVILSALFPVYFASLVPPEGGHLPGLAAPVPAGALWGYAVSGSLLLVAIVAPYLGALADRHGWQYRILSLCAIGGASAATLLVLPGPGQYLAAALLFMLANLGFAGGNIFYNAYLPLIAAGQEIDRLSSRGYALGYLGGALPLLIAFIMIKSHAWFGFPDVAAASRASFLLAGLWWGGFSLPTLLALPRVPSGRSTPQLGLTPREYLRTLRDLRRYPDLLRFLAAFLLYNDGIQTIIVVSALFGSEELGLSQGEILACFLMIQFLAMPGTLLCERAALRIGALRTVQLALLLFLLITLFAFVMQSAWQFWLLAVLVALVLGGAQALSRSLFAGLVPLARSSEFFGFFAISNKFAAILGPFLFALINHLTGSTRQAILVLALFFILGLVLLARVDFVRGRKTVEQAG